MTLYKWYDQYCSGKEYVTNFEIGLEFAEIIAGFSLEVSFSIFFIYLCKLWRSDNHFDYDFYM